MHSKTRTAFPGGGGRRILLGLTAAKLALHLATIRGYGIFRDELYYLDCARHLSWGYVDQPPLIALVAWATSLLGESLFAIRLPAALAGAGLVFLAGLLAKEMGGGRFAVGLAGLTVLVAPGNLLFHHIFTMNAFEPLFWMGCAYLLVRILNTGKATLWLWFGVIAGVGLLNKHSMLFFGFALTAGLLLTPERTQFRERRIWLGALIAFVIFLPHLIWQIQNGFPQLEILQTTRAHRDVRPSPLEFFGGQALFLNPATLPVWLSGIWFFFGTARGRRYRALGWAFVVIAGLFLAMRAKFYYLMPAYPMLLAAGSVHLETLFERRRWVWLKPASVTLLLAAGALLAPLALPLLPEETFIRYAAWLGVPEPQTERQRRGRLPQHYADMHGWQNMAAQVAEVFHRLPPEDRRGVAIFGQDFGQAGAINHFGPSLGLPPAISGHNSYFLWGPGDAGRARVVIVLGDDRETLETIFDQVERGGTVVSEYARPDETDLPIWVCRRPRVSIEELWPRLKHYD